MLEVLAHSLLVVVDSAVLVVYFNIVISATSYNLF